MAKGSENKNTLKEHQTIYSSQKVKKKPTKKKTAAKNRLAQWRMILGIFLAFTGIFMAIAFLSYLINWFSFGSDQSLLDFTFREILDSSQQHRNWTGRFGAAVANLFIYEWFGIGSFLISFYIFSLGLFLSSGFQFIRVGRGFIYSLILLIWISATSAYLIGDNTEASVLSGMFGYEGNVFMRSVIGRAGTGILLLFILVSITTAAYNIPLKWFHFEEWREKQKERRTMRRAARKERHEQKKRDRENRKKLKNQPLSPNDSDSPEGNNYAPQTAQPPHVQNTEPSEDNHQTREPETTPQEPSAPPAPGQLINEKDQVRFTIEKPLQPEEDISPTPPSAMRQGSLGTDYDPTLDLPHFRFPEYDLLKTYDDATPIAIQNQELKENKQQIVDTLNHYAIKITSIKATPGPAVTLYEIVPAPGIRIAKIKNLADDIALSLAAHGIRIIAPIPGKGTIGIEVPNKNPQTVSMKTLLKSSKFVQSKYELPIALGKTISNDSFIADLAKMPHLLVAGATGQGKSVGLNGIIASLLYSKHPAVCKFILIDPKKVELSLYSKIERHYLAKLPDAKEAIITETREVVRTLNSLVLEMEDRYNLLKNAHVKSLKEYNTKFIARKLNPENGHRFMPYLILIIDEFADLIMTAGKEIEGPITRLAQLARAVGIHLIIATQRPSVNVITGSIKANFPARIAYRVISKFDSRTILDSGGADQLVGRGDMLLSTGRELVRLQGAFIDTPEIERITEFIGAQKAYSNAFQLPEYLDEESETRKDLEDLGRDTMFEEAARVVVENQHGSTSLLQRKLKIGYNRAGRIIDQLEAAGIVGPFEGSKAREVMIRDIIGLEQLLKELDNINK